MGAGIAGYHDQQLIQSGRKARCLEIEHVSAAGTVSEVTEAHAGVGSAGGPERRRSAACANDTGCHHTESGRRDIPPGVVTQLETHRNGAARLLWSRAVEPAEVVAYAVADRRSGDIANLITGVNSELAGADRFSIDCHAVGNGSVTRSDTRTAVCTGVRSRNRLVQQVDGVGRRRDGNGRATLINRIACEGAHGRAVAG